MNANTCFLDLFVFLFMLMHALFYPDSTYLILVVSYMLTLKFWWILNSLLRTMTLSQLLRDSEKKCFVLLFVCCKNMIGLVTWDVYGELWGSAPHITLVCAVSAVWPPVGMRTQSLCSDWLTTVVIVEQLVWHGVTCPFITVFRLARCLPSCSW